MLFHHGVKDFECRGVLFIAWVIFTFVGIHEITENVQVLDLAGISIGATEETIENSGGGGEVGLGADSPKRKFADQLQISRRRPVKWFGLCCIHNWYFHWFLLYSAPVKGRSTKAFGLS